MAGVASLSPLREELDNTVAEIIHRLESFTEDRTNTILLQDAQDALSQILGIVRIVELGGAELLVNELILALSELPVTGNTEEQDASASQASEDEALDNLGQGLLIFQRYVDFILSRRDEMPELLLPAVNQLRNRRNVASLPESQFFQVRMDIGTMSGEPLCDDPARSRQTTRRLRQMYQIGLLGLLHHQRPYAGMKLMQRATTHLAALHAHLPFSRFCRVVGACLESFIDMEMAVNRPRSILFSRVDQLFRKLQMPAGLESLDVPDAFLKEMLYLVAVSGSQGPLSSAVRDEFSMLPLPFSDKTLKETREAMAGPASEVMVSLSRALTEELSAVKDMLDLAERGASSTDLDYAGLVSSMSTLSKTLSMVGLHSAASTLKKQQSQVQLWQEQREGASEESLQSVAEAVLYVEAMVSSLGQVSPTNLPEASDQSVRNSQLTEAQFVVWDEALSGLTLTKRAISAYLESDYDKIHLENLPKTLQAIRGGLQFSGEERGASLIQSCADFIRNDVLESGERPKQATFETFADVLSSLEYYLEASSTGGGRGEQALELAESSLNELGYESAVA